MMPGCMNPEFDQNPMQIWQNKFIHYGRLISNHVLFNIGVLHLDLLKTTLHAYLTNNSTP